MQQHFNTVFCEWRIKLIIIIINITSGSRVIDFSSEKIFLKNSYFVILLFGGRFSFDLLKSNPKMLTCSEKV